MAIEFGSRRETFENYKVYETMLAGRPFKVEMGKMCGLSNASALIRYGETCVLCNVVMSPKPREGVDFFPLNVEYEEKLYAAGRIPGSFMRREGRPGERAILTSRVVDRPMRPLFPKEMRNDVCITMTVMSLRLFPENTRLHLLKAALRYHPVCFSEERSNPPRIVSDPSALPFQHGISLPYAGF